MKKFGSGENGEWTFIDLVSVISFIVGLQNLDLNITQETLDKQTAELKERVDDDVNDALIDIHSHLELQDAKLHMIMERLEIMT